MVHNRKLGGQQICGCTRCGCIEYKYGNVYQHGNVYLIWYQYGYEQPEPRSYSGEFPHNSYKYW
jgi:hypothetical protein